jgi:hypothetical protein
VAGASGRVFQAVGCELGPTVEALGQAGKLELPPHVCSLLSSGLQPPTRWWAPTHLRARLHPHSGSRTPEDAKAIRQSIPKVRRDPEIYFAGYNKHVLSLAKTLRLPNPFTSFTTFPSNALFLTLQLPALGAGFTRVEL